jgi:hypothetical protein
MVHQRIAQPARYAACATVLCVLSQGGCAWIVGLQDHHLDQSAPDASAADSPSDVSTDPDVFDASQEDAPVDTAIDQNQEQTPEASDDAADAEDAQPEADVEAAAPVLITVNISADQDDATWIHCTQSPSDERLYISPTEHWVCVSDDADDECTGLRFDLSGVPAKATITSATLTVTKVSAPIYPENTIQVKVWDSTNTPQFDESHTELAVNHDPAATVWGAGAVQDWHPQPLAGPTTSPDVKALVQHVVDLPSWGATGTYVTFLLQRQSIYNMFVCFADFSSGVNAASLTVTYQP